MSLASNYQPAWCTLSAEINGMAIQFTCVARDGVLWVTASGKDDGMADVQEFNVAVYQQMKANNCKRVCSDERLLQYDISLIDTFKIAEQAARHAGDIERLAITCQEKFWKEVSFFEDVAVNRGLTVRFFVDHNEAARWILER